jgi:hypothetical protein
MAQVLDINTVRAQMGIESVEGFAAVQSLDDGFVSADISDAWDAEIARRRREVADGRVALVNGNEVFRRAFAKYA